MQETTQATQVYNLSEVSRLITYIGQHAIDSEQTPVRSGEVPILINRLIGQLVWQNPYLDQVIQELLDDMRFHV